MKKGCGLLFAIIFLLSGCAGNDSMDNAEKWYRSNNIINYNESIYAFDRVYETFSVNRY